jgi:hypothetical protein
MIFQIFWINFLLFIWFDTDAFIEYFRLLRLSKLFKIDKFDEYKTQNPKITYLSFIRQKYSNFYTRLITCPPCINFWIVLLFCIILNYWFIIILFIFCIIYLLLLLFLRFFYYCFKSILV